jgi:dTDP-4-dehydrorhamnose reductase
MRCLVVGGTGVIGSHLLAACGDRRYATLGTGYRRPPADFAPLDVRDADAVTELVADYQPDATFFAAGGPAGVQAAGAANVSAAVARHGGTLLFVGGDEVFGDCPAARNEGHPVAPANGRGREQAAAEAAVRAALPGRHLILRAGWAFGPGGGDALAGWARRWAAGEVVEAAADRDGQPTFAPDLAEAAVELVKARHAGTVHVTGPDRHTEFTFARLACHVLGYDADLVQPVAGTCDRPARVHLCRAALRRLLGAKAVRGTADGLRAVRAARHLAPALARAA